MAMGMAVACSNGATAGSDAAVDGGGDALAPIGGDRPLSLLRAPEGWDQKTPLPLLLVLHGYGIGGYAQAIYFGVLPLVEEKQILLAAPDGTFDSYGKRFWNATDTCCDFDKRNIDDVKYLTGVVDEIAARYPVDRKRVYVIGHSNGGAMSMRLACDKAGTFAAVFELAGPFWSDPQVKCAPSMPIAMRVVHGTADVTVPYDGGAVAAGVGPLIPGPSAAVIAQFFATKNGCAATPDDTAAPIDLEATLAGSETRVSRYTGCPAGGDVELWSIQGGGHIPNLSPQFRSIVWDYLSAHTR
jgi:polyhydroxybutyrate depolymerase